MSKPKRSGTAHGRNGEQDISPASDNLIIAVVETSLRGKRPTIVFDIFESMPAGHMREWIKRRFDDEAIREIGAFIIESLLTGDRRMVGTIQDAIKQADHLFSRDREKVLLRKALIYLKFRGGWKLDVAAFKKAIEQEFNNGQTLAQHRWNRLRKALHLPKLDAGRPSKFRHETR